jgi:hypothetical protein
VEVPVFVNIRDKEDTAKNAEVAVFVNTIE